MHNTPIAHFRSLRTAAIDAENGYREAHKQAKGVRLVQLFELMATFHKRDAEDLAVTLRSLGVEPDDGGSLLNWINKTLMEMRSLFGGLSASVLSALIDGETRIIAKYDAALDDPEMNFSNIALLRRQRNRLNESVNQMHAMEALPREINVAD